MNKIAVILVNYKTYANEYLTECWRSLLAQSCRNRIKVFLVDNATSEKSVAEINGIVSNFLEKIDWELITNNHNDGFAKGNNDAIKLAINQGFDKVLLLNMDTVSDRKSVELLAEALDQQPQAGCVQARLMLYENKIKINSLGNNTHFLGFGFCSGYGDVYDRSKKMNLNIAYPSGAAVMFRVKALQEVGLLDEMFWMYNEDQDLGWRLWLANWSCRLAPEAVVYHKYEFSRSISKYYWMDRNRNLVMLKNYDWRTLLLILPAWLIMDCGQILFALKGGWFKEKIKSYAFFFNINNLLYIWHSREKIQKLRKAKERDIIKMFSGQINYQEIDNLALRLANLFLKIYWQVVKKIIKY